MTSEAKLKISNVHNLETIIDIKTISFLQSPLLKMQLLIDVMTFDIRGQF